MLLNNKRGRAQNQSNKKMNFHVIIDLSQRAKASYSSNQFAIDMNYLNHILKSFKERVKSLGYIGSQDRLDVSLVYGKKRNGRLRDERIHYRLSLRDIPLKDRRNKLDSELNKVRDFVKYNYQKISKSDDPGSCDLIGEFRHYYSPMENAENYVFLITDGLLSFKFKIREGNRTSYIDWNALKKNDWKNKIISGEIGFLKVNHTFPNTKVIILGFDIGSHQDEDYYAKFKVDLLWQAWFKEMKVRDVVIYENATDSDFRLNDFSKIIKMNDHDH